MEEHDEIFELIKRLRELQFNNDLGQHLVVDSISDKETIRMERFRDGEPSRGEMLGPGIMIRFRYTDIITDD